MNEKEFENEMKYQISLQMAESLLKMDCISKPEFNVINTKLLEKYHPTLSTLLSGKPLIL